MGKQRAVHEQAAVDFILDAVKAELHKHALLGESFAVCAGVAEGLLELGEQVVITAERLMDDQ